MNLYNMLGRTLYDGNVYIIALDKYDGKHTIFVGEVQEARKDEYVWDYLTNKVDRYYVYRDYIVVEVKTKSTWSSSEGINHTENEIDKRIELESEK